MPGNATQHERLCAGKVASAILLGIVGGVNTSSADWRSPAARLPEMGYETVALRRTGENHLFLFGQVNGRRRSCLVDTGWSLSTVSTNTAARLTPPRVVSELKLGRVVVTNTPVVVQDLRINGRPAPYDVVLGCDFLMRRFAVLDCASNRLYLRSEPPSTMATEEFENQLRAAGWVGVELQRHEPLALTCEARIKDQPIQLLVDSGAVWSCLDTKVAQALDLSLSPSPNRIRGAGAVGQRELSVADLRNVRIGSRDIRQLSVAVFSLRDWGLGPEGAVLENVGGILGGSELATLKAVIDCHQLKLWIRKAD